MVKIDFCKNGIKIDGVKFCAVYIPVKEEKTSGIKAIKIQLFSFISFKDDLKGFEVTEENGFDVITITKRHKRFLEAGRQMLRSLGN